MPWVERLIAAEPGNPAGWYSKAEILAELGERLERTREEELDTALGELVAIARDRLERG